MDHISLIFNKSQICPNQNIIKNIIKNKSSIIEATMKDITFRTNPVEPSKAEVEAIFDHTMKKIVDNEY